MAEPKRTQPKRMPADWNPRGSAWSAQFGPEVDQVVMAYIGAQSAVAGDEVAAIREIAAILAGVDGPDHHDRAHYVDEAGYSTTILVAYWLDPERFQRWSDGDAADWWRSADQRTDGTGCFLEIVAPPSDRFETIFSSDAFSHGISVLADSMGEPVREHMYWGAMRDRLPVAAADPLDPGPADTLRVEREGARVRVIPPGNLCLIRSGQRYGDTSDEERQVYLGEIEPTLRAGMDFLRDHGPEVGCITARYVTELDPDGRSLPVTFGHCWFRSLADLEDWAANHPTHQAIFAQQLDLYRRFREDLRLELWHEVSVIAGDGQLFEYVNCHPRTGLLNLVPTVA